MSFYEKLGINRVINCFGTYTMIGGHTFSDYVRVAMDEADRNFAWLWELEEKAGKRICELTGAEAAFVTPGVFAALSMGAAAAMVGTDQDKMSKLPDTTGLRNEFIIQRPLRDFKYDRSMTIAGGKLVEAGSEKTGCTLDMLAAAISYKTAGFHYMSHGTTGSFASKNVAIVPIDEVIELAHSYGLPVLVDAAFQCYPKDGFKRYIEKGADLVAYSCKYFGGPNTAGIVLGKKELIDAVAIHSFVGQEGGPSGKLFLTAKPGKMHGSVFRGYKMDRSSIMGGVASLEEHLDRNYEAIFNEARAKADVMIDAWSKLSGVKFKLYDIGEVFDEPGRISLHLVLDRKPEEIDSIVRKLLQGNSPIWVSREGNDLVINITSFRGLMLTESKDTATIIAKVTEVLK